MAVDDNGVAYLLCVFAFEEVATAAGKFSLYLVVYLIECDDCVFGRADHAVVKHLGVNDGVYRHQNVCRVVDNSRVVTRSYTQSRLTRAVCSQHHARTTRCQNGISFVHNGIGEVDRRFVYPADNVFGKSCFLGCVADDFRSFNSRLNSTWVRGNNDCVTRFYAEKGLEDSRSSGVGGRNNCSYDTNWLGNLFEAIGLVLKNNAAGLGVTIGIVDVLSGEVVFDNFVFDKAHTRLGNRRLSKRNTRIVCSHCSFKENLIHLFLGKCCKHFLCFAHLGKLRFERIDAIDYDCPVLFLTGLFGCRLGCSSIRLRHNPSKQSFPLRIFCLFLVNRMFLDTIVTDKWVMGIENFLS